LGGGNPINHLRFKRLFILAGVTVVNGVVMGPFEEEEEGTGVTSDVVKVEGEDPATPGPLP